MPGHLQPGLLNEEGESEMISLDFLEVADGRVYTVWSDPDDVLKTIAQELSRDGIVMVGIGCTERGVID